MHVVLCVDIQKVHDVHLFFFHLRTYTDCNQHRGSVITPFADVRHMDKKRLKSYMISFISLSPQSGLGISRVERHSGQFPPLANMFTIASAFYRVEVFRVLIFIFKVLIMPVEYILNAAIFL